VGNIMPRYAEVFEGRMVAEIERNDDKVPEFAGNRSAVDITNETPRPQPGWLWDGNTWTQSTLPPPKPRSSSQLDRMDDKLDQILEKLTPRPA